MYSPVSKNQAPHQAATCAEAQKNLPPRKAIKNPGKPGVCMCFRYAISKTKKMSARAS